MSERAPGFTKYPDHRVDILPSTAHVQVRLAGQLIADSHRPLKVNESRHGTVWYVPLADVAGKYLTTTEHTTYCPFKGHACYWTLTVGGTVRENAVWAYPDPFSECLALKDHVAFYTDRVDLVVEEPPA